MGKGGLEAKTREREAAVGIAAQLAALDRMSTGELAERFHEVFGFPARSRNKPYLRKRVAWRIQELAEGGLSQRALQRIEELAPLAPVRWRQPAGKDGMASLPNGGPTPTKTRDSRLPPAGTVLVRRHNGIDHRVMVLEDGFEYQGERFRSLSKIATRIAGTRWNGYFFFGCASRAGNKTGGSGE